MTLEEMGRRCKATRTYYKYTQQEVADECGVTQPIISRFEKGEDDSATLLSWYLSHGLEIKEEIR